MDRPINRYIDHTLLRPDATEEDIRRLVSEAIEYDFAAVCVNGCYVATAKVLLDEAQARRSCVRCTNAPDMRSSDQCNNAPCESSSPETASHDTESTGAQVKIAAVVGFPLGAASTASKIEETRIAIEDGAAEIDMVINIGAVKDRRWDYVRKEISDIAQVCHGSDRSPAILKVILETCLLTDEEIVEACRVCARAGADYVKTSTGFDRGGATVHHVRLMRETVGNNLKVKASGGIRTLADAKAMIDAGADRLGCSASVAITKESASMIG